MDVNEITGDWDYSALPANVRIGNGCFLERADAFARFRSTRDPGLVLGARVRIFMWTTFTVEAGGCLTIGDDSVIVGATFMCADRITLGARCAVQYHVTIADSDFHPIAVEARRQDAIASSPSGDKSKRSSVAARPVEIGDDVWIGTGAIILKGVRIGSGATIAPGAVVARDVPANGYAIGNPAAIEVE